MRRLLVIVSVGWLALVVVPAALAQAKDPFQPVPAVPGSGGGVPVPQAPVPAAPGGGPVAGPIAHTGTDVELQMIAAALLLIFGVAIRLGAAAFAT